MRKFALMLLLAATAVPAMAQSDDDHRSQRGDDPSAQSTDDRETYRQMRSSRSDRQDSDRPAPTAQRGDGDDGAREARRAQRIQKQQQQAMQAMQVQQQAASNGDAEARQQRRFQRQSQQNAQYGEGDRNRDYGQRRFEGRHDRDAQAPAVTQDGVRQWNGRQRDGQSWDGQQSSGWQQRERRVRTVPDSNIARPEGMSGPERMVRDGERRRYDRDGSRWGNNSRWSHHWRGDRRYDWRRHRDRNRSSFRLGFYYDPFGWNYRRFSTGTYLWPNYYSQNYWINDPWRYRLPPAYGPYRWVRYHNDALLIDIWTGQVVDVIYGFFW